MYNISLICVFNNSKMKDIMVESAKKQKDVNIEYILIDNTEKQFSSGASALNYGISLANHDCLVFTHQDIEFLDEYALFNFAKYCSENPSTLAGVAGVKKWRNRYLLAKFNNKINYCLYDTYIGKSKNLYKSISIPTEAFNLDECFFVTNKRNFNDISFNEKICNGWHLYTVELCLQAKEKGIKSYVLPAENIWHKSLARVDSSFYESAYQLATAYKKKYKVINTSWSVTYTKGIMKKFQLLFKKVVGKIH